MACNVCATVQQFALNVALAIDRLLNAALLGDANETLSQRTARAAVAGGKVAKAACWLMDKISPGHCAWSLEPGTVGKEIWRWD